MPKLPHVRSPQYRKAIVDSAVAVHIGNPLSDTIQLSLTKSDFVTSGEEITMLPGGAYNILPNTTEGQLQKTIEFTAEMTPDVALVLANTILESLRRMPDDKKAKYLIPDTIAQVQPARRP